MPDVPEEQRKEDDRMTILGLLQNRRSIRRYTGEAVSEEKLQKILQAGLLVPSSRSIYPVELIVVRKKDMLTELSKCKNTGAQMLKDADAAVVVIADTAKSDVWVEDCAVTMTAMILEAQELGVGSCWVQMRQRTVKQNEQEIAADNVLRSLLGYPETYEALAVLSLGISAQQMPAHELSALDLNKVHRETY